MKDTREFWDEVAEDWDIQVGTEGDSNRVLNSDPVLWSFAGDVRGLSVLDAGCGTGYLSGKLHQKGASVIGVDFSGCMIAAARKNHPGLDFRVDSCSTLETVETGSIDLIVSNYVLMDTPDLESSVGSFHRVLRNDGVVIAVFSHPCFPQGRSASSADDGSVTYRWPFPYFQRRRCTDPPWGHFKSEFIWFHRPLSDYWKAFTGAGFLVDRFEEPRIAPERYHLAENERKLNNSLSRPYSVAFRLLKAGQTRESVH